MYKNYNNIYNGLNLLTTQQSLGFCFGSKIQSYTLKRIYTLQRRTEILNYSINIKVNIYQGDIIKLRLPEYDLGVFPNCQWLCFPICVKDMIKTEPPPEGWYEDGIS